MIGRLKMTMGKQLILWPCLPNGCCSQFIWITSNPILENPQYFPHWTCTHLKMSGGSARFLMSTYHSTVKATTVSSQKVLMTFQVQSTKMQYLRLFSTHPGIHKPLGMWIQPIPGYWGKVLGKGLPPLPICSWKKNSVPNVLYFKKLLQFLVLWISQASRSWKLQNNYFRIFLAFFWHFLAIQGWDLAFVWHFFSIFFGFFWHFFGIFFSIWYFLGIFLALF